MKSVIIVGAGISGLSCAVHLKNAGCRVSVIERSDGVGGRVRSDRVEGFILDRGFQVLSEAYPEAKRILNYSELDLRCFGSGALVFQDGGLHLFADPMSHPGEILSALKCPAGSLRDKLRLLRMQRELRARPMEAVWSAPESTSLDYLRRRGFSDSMIRHFLAPFFRGIFLENGLQTSSRMLEFVFSMFAQGRATLPAGGMQAVPDQLAARIGEADIQLNAEGVRAEASGITLESGEVLTSDAVVWAVPEAGKDSDWQGTVQLYFDAPAAPFAGPWLALNGSGEGRINQMAVPSNVAPAYAPEGRSLVSVSVNGIPEGGPELLEDTVRRECGVWFGDQVERWRLLRVYTIPRALPRQMPGRIPFARNVKDERGIFHAGDDTRHASLQGAMESGRRAAEAVLCA